MDKKKMQHYYEAYAEMIYRLGFTYMKNASDAEDVVQETFLRLVRQTAHFTNEEHVKAWLIVTASNYCKSMLRHWWNRRTEMREIEEKPDDSHDYDAILDAVLELPDRYKTAIFLYYYEGYSSEEIALILHKPAGTIRSYLFKGRLLQKEKIQKGDWV